jgi:hypothetical protein
MQSRLPMHKSPRCCARTRSGSPCQQNRGFVVMTQDSGFDHKRLAREWRITIFPTGDCRAPTAPPTHDYVHWRPASEKQKPVPFRDTHSAVWDTHLVTIWVWGTNMRTNDCEARVRRGPPEPSASAIRPATPCRVVRAGAAIFAS